MPYLTPDEIPEDALCRPLFIPNDTAWLAIVSGAITELTKTWNWEKFGTLTRQECVDRMQLMVDQYYASACTTCEQPDGEPWVGLDELGRWRMLDGGDYVEPYGDYAIPALTARTGGTAQQRRCLASKNAVNVLEELYEAVSDAAESGIQAAEFLVDFALLIGLFIAPPLGLLAKAFLAITVFAYKEFFSFADFITEDFWNAEFTEKLECIFYDNSSDTAGVVTFDFEAIYQEIFNTQNFDLVVQGLRLAGQVMFLLRTIGEEGLNLAGETTAITDDDCSNCEAWCFRFGDFGTRLGDWTAGYWNNSNCDNEPTFASNVWTANIARNNGCVGNSVRYVHITWILPYSITLTDAAVHSPQGVIQNAGVWVNGTNDIFTGTQVWSNAGWLVGTLPGVNRIDVLMYRPVNDTTAFNIDWVQLSGLFEQPFGDANC